MKREYTGLIEEFHLTDDFYYSDTSPDISCYGVYDGQFHWFERDRFREFMLHGLVGHYFQLQWNQPGSLEEGLETYFGPPERAREIVQELRDISDAVLTADKGFEAVRCFLGQFFFHEPVTDMAEAGRTVYWIGKVSGLVSGDTEFARNQRIRFYREPGPLVESQVQEFFRFLDLAGDLYVLRAQYDFALRMPYEVQQMEGDEPGSFLMSAADIIQEINELMTDNRDQPQVLELIREYFPEIGRELQEGT